MRRVFEQIADPAAAMSRESSMFDQPGANGRLAMWSTRRCLVVPRSLSRRPGFEDAERALRRAGMPIVVRSTGGGIVPQGPGILNISIAVPISAHERAPHGDYAWLCRPLCDHLSDRGIDSRLGAVPGSFCDGAHNVVVDDRKLAGTAQRRGRSSALLHMVVLVEPELDGALDAVASLARALGIDVVCRSAHTTLAGCTADSSSVAEVAAALLPRLQAHLRARVHTSG